MVFWSWSCSTDWTGLIRSDQVELSQNGLKPGGPTSSIRSCTTTTHYLQVRAALICSVDYYIVDTVQGYVWDWDVVEKIFWTFCWYSTKITFWNIKISVLCFYREGYETASCWLATTTTWGHSSHGWGLLNWMGSAHITQPTSQTLPRALPPNWPQGLLCWSVQKCSSQSLGNF